MQKEYETPLSRKIVRYIKSIPNCWAYKRHAGPNRKGSPDISGSVNGIRLEIEVKVGDNTPTDLQLKHLDRWTEMNAITACVWSIKEVKFLMKNIIAEEKVTICMQCYRPIMEKSIVEVSWLCSVCIEKNDKNCHKK